MTDPGSVQESGTRPDQPLWVRVDDRLIHGQVTVAWRRHLGYRAIWVVDDGVAGEPYLCDALRLAAPPGVRVDILSVAAALGRLREGAGGGGRLLLLRGLGSAQELVAGGAPLTHLIVGNLAWSPGARRVVRAIALTAADVAALDGLAGQGVQIAFQPTPDDPALPWAEVRRRWARG
ncbi:MAG: PTS sugar transporter subunit IIB [Anaerolineae bacterium]|nr:PTS sugar transporter subunit IIB [Anaerolineae bacterium]